MIYQNNKKIYENPLMSDYEICDSLIRDFSKEISKSSKGKLIFIRIFHFL